MLIGTLLVTSRDIVKGTSFAIGFAFFGHPVLTRALDLLNRTIPNWAEYVDLRK